MSAAAKAPVTDMNEIALTLATSAVRGTLSELHRIEPRDDLDEVTKAELVSPEEELLRRVARMSKARMVRAERAVR